MTSLLKSLNRAFNSMVTTVLMALVTAFLVGVLLGGSAAVSAEDEAAISLAHAQGYNAALECLYLGYRLGPLGCDKTGGPVR